MLRLNLLILICIFLSSCDNDDMTPDSDLLYLLTKIRLEGSGEYGQTYKLTYNSENLIAEIERTEWAIYIINGEEEIRQSTVYTHFEYINNILYRSSIGNQAFYEYHYSDNLISKRFSYSDNSIVEITEFEYVNNDVLNFIRVLNDKGQIKFTYSFQYENQNLQSITMVRFTDDNPTKTKYEYSSFDQNMNFSKAIYGLPTTFAWNPIVRLANTIQIYSSTSPNNFQLERYFEPVDINSDFEDPIVTEYSYQYNEIGLPTTMSYGIWTVSFEYENY